MLPTFNGDGLPGLQEGPPTVARGGISVLLVHLCAATLVSGATGHVACLVPLFMYFSLK